MNDSFKNHTQNFKFNFALSIIETPQFYTLRQF